MVIVHGDETLAGPELGAMVSSDAVLTFSCEPLYVLSIVLSPSPATRCPKADGGQYDAGTGMSLRKVSKSCRSSACIIEAEDDGDEHRCPVAGIPPSRGSESRLEGVEGRSNRRLAGRPVGFCAEYIHSVFTREHLRQDGAPPSHFTFFFPTQCGCG